MPPPDPKLAEAIEKLKKKSEGRVIVGVKGPVVPWAGNYKPPAKNEWVSDSVGLGNWNYSVANATDQRGPNGETMAPGQKAWDKYGRPYYGFGFVGFANAAKSKYEQEIKRLTAKQQERWYNAFIPGLDTKSIQIRAAGKAFLDVVGMINVFAETTEQGIGTVAGLGEAGTALGSPLPEIGAQKALPTRTGENPLEIFRKKGTLGTLPGGEWAAGLLQDLGVSPGLEQSAASYAARAGARAKNAPGLAANLTRIGNAYNSFRILTAPASIEEKMDAVKAQYQASKILYTNVMEPAVKQEFMRRYAAGEDPGLLALELQNPLYEFMGQMALDPLNLYGHAGKAARQTANLRGTAEFYEAGGEIADALRAFRTGDQAEAMQSLTRLVDGANAQYRTKVAASAVDFGITAATAPAKRAAFVDTSMSLLNRLAKDVRDPDTFIELMQAMILRGSDDIYEVREGVSRLLSIANKGTSSPSMLLSGAGDELAFALREGIGADPVKFYDEVLEIVAKGDIVNDAGDTITAAERLAQHSELKLGQVAEQLFPDIATRIARGEDVGRTATVLHNFEKKAGKGYRFLNEFYSRIYLGMSPGYAMRNAIQNTFQIFVDEKLFNPFAHASHNNLGLAWMGDVQSRAAMREIRSPLAGIDLPTPKKSWFRSLTTTTSELANKFEGTASQSVVGLSIDRNMRKMLPRGLESARPILGAAGVPDDQIRAIEQLIMQGKGDVAGALDMVTQRADAFRLLSSHSPEEAKALEGFGTLLSDVEEILGMGLSRAESQSRILALADEIDSIADDVLTEIPGVSKDADGFADAVVYSAIENDESLRGSFNALIQANNNSMDVTLLAADQALQKIASPTFMGRLSAEQAAEARSILARYGELVNPETRYLIRNFAETSGDDFMRIVEELKELRGQPLSLEDTARFFEEFGMPGTPPARNVAAQEMLDEAYWWFRETKRRFYAQVRDHAYVQTSALMDEILALGADLDDTLFMQATQLRQEAEAFQDAFMLKDGLHRISLGGVEGASIPELRPFQFGIGGEEVLRLPQTGDIRSSRELLNIINEYNPSGKTFDSLKDVTMETARRALANREADLAQATLEFAEGAAQAAPEVAQAVRRPGSLGEIGQLENFSLRRQPGGVAPLVEITVEGSESVAQGASINYVSLDTDTLHRFMNDPDELRAFVKSKRGEGATVEAAIAEYRQAFGEAAPEAGRALRPFEMTREQYFDALENSRVTGNNIENAILGDRANEWRAAQRNLGSVDKNKADKAQSIIDEIEGALSSADKDKLYGIGVDAAPEDLSEYRRAFEPLDDATDDFLFSRVGQNITEVPPEKTRSVLSGQAQFTTSEEIAFIQSREAIRVLQDRGYGADEIMQTVAKSLEADVGLENAKVLLNEWIDAAQATPEAGRAALAAPEAVQFERLAPPYDGRTPSISRVAHESREGVRATLETIVENMEGTAGRTVEIGMDDDLRRAYESVASQRVQEARSIVMDVAEADRDFALHDYRMRNNFDQALGYVYPYQFWYSRTYTKWLQRLAYQPNILSGYLRYKDYMSKIHAGAPDWWKYNINTNELLGLDWENPLMFNLEALVNPLNAISGVDFNDPYKRTSWFTSAIDDMGKYGPSIHSIYSLLVAVGLYATGEKDAASRWAGRLFPQTGTLIKPATALALDKPVEVDPWVWLFSGGMDPYERRRVQRGLSAMVNEGLIGEADAIEAARLQEGTVWDEAVLRATQERAPGQLSSFFLGAGFKPRSQSDMQIDKFYQDWYRLWDMEPNLSPGELRGAMNELREAYPFMDTLLLSRKGGLDRDRAYVYNVLGRIPPAMSDDIAEAAGIDPELLEAFYEQKGHTEAWAETDRQRFMAGIVDIAAILDLPDGATRDTWNDAREAYNEVKKLGEKQFGQGIWAMVDSYFAMRGTTREERDAANEYLEANPAVSAALDWQSQAIMFSPTLSAYYTSLDKIEAYYKGQMYSAIENELGTEIYNLLERKYGNSEKLSPAEEKIIRRYWDIKDEWEQVVAASTINVAQMIQSGPGPALRDIEDELGIGARNTGQFVEGLPAEMAIPPEMLVAAIGERAFRIYQDGPPYPDVFVQRMRSLGLEDLLEENLQ